MIKPIEVDSPSNSMHRVNSNYQVQSNGVGNMDEIEIKAIYRKVDWQIVPLAFLCYFLQFLDKVLINYANIMGLQTDLGMKGQDFSWMATAFFIAYAIAEFPQGFLLQKFPAAKVLGVNILLWGVTICCTAAVQNFAGAVAVRTLLGVFESVITPSLIIITASWYTKKQSTPRYGLWYCGLGAGQIIGGLISFAAQHGPKYTHFPGWRIMMVTVGVLNLISAIIVLVYMPDGIQSAHFITDSEKSILQSVLAADHSGTGRRVLKLSSLWETARDIQVWLLFLITVLISIPSGVITTFSATLIAGFGYKPETSALLNMPSGVVSIFATLLCTFVVLKDFPRWLGIIAMLVPTMIGAGLMSFLPKTNKAGVLAGIYLINFDVAPLALVYALQGSNVAGYTKRVATNSFIAMGFGIANIIGPQTFRANQAPGYLGAKVTIFAVNGGTIVVAILLRLLYGYRNSRKLKSDARKIHRGEEQDWTDMTNPSFKYVY